MFIEWSTPGPTLVSKYLIVLFLECYIDFILLHFYVDDEELQLQDEPEPEKLSKKVKAKDDLNAYTLSESEEEREADEELTNVGKELKEILKRETGEDESSAEEDEEDEDIDESEKYTKSALFMPGKFCTVSSAKCLCDAFESSFISYLFNQGEVTSNL